ncbi:4-phosphoerythronate dehydrogenase [Halieaceae bacterium IMCC14734]|uniref:Erythronate-4-phosphate dehydrogenase n=1 Tax=Candidatus Litorirhabdus singularis TaxID=2518993 RepID=A0ABT3TGR0_9GAMM|nr:4-phosphoerythronate dehydrogenase [Candidatus Litorirhabdus singularis]MCX2981459.1 4-phosphoerythronate dehydrogenase [Candidatus Litorirhabdus singularis]
MRIVADSNMVGVEELFGALGSVALYPGRELRAEHVRDADILLVRSVTSVGASLLDGSAVSFVGTATSGFDHVDVDYLAAQGVGFAHAPGSNANSVLEYVISAIASCDDYLEQLCAGGTVGIVGFGVIGKRLAARLNTMGIACCAYDPWLERGSDQRLVDLDQVLNCTVICVHAELTRREPWPSYHLLDAEALQRISLHSLLINAGRGPIVDNNALKQLLSEQPQRRVILDVWEHEPTIDVELMQRCFFATPHIAGYSYDGKVLATRMLRDSACRALGLTIPDASSGQLESLSLEVPANLFKAQLIRWLQANSYSVRSDDERMRLNAGADFDQQRSDYPRRRELASLSIVNAKQLDAEQLALCQALGIQC